MANLAASQILEDGPRNTVVKFEGSLDTSDLDSTVVVNISSQYRDPIGDAIGQYRVDKIEYTINDPISVDLWWGGVPTQFASIIGRGILDLGKRFGGIQDNESTTVRDGRILATTTGYVAGTITFSLVLWLVKQAFISAGVAQTLITGDGDPLVTGDGDTLVVYA